MHAGLLESKVSTFPCWLLSKSIRYFICLSSCIRNLSIHCHICVFIIHQSSSVQLSFIHTSFAARLHLYITHPDTQLSIIQSAIHSSIRLPSICYLSICNGYSCICHPSTHHPWFISLSSIDILLLSIHPSIHSPPNHSLIIIHPSVTNLFIHPFIVHLYLSIIHSSVYHYPSTVFNLKPYFRAIGNCGGLNQNGCHTLVYLNT